jgi:hypothetical protein
MLASQTRPKVIDLKYVPRQWQLICHKSLRRFSVLALHRRAGKTELAIMRLIDAALRFDKELGLFFYVAPFLKQAKAIAWARLKQRLGPLVTAGAVEINESDLSVKFLGNGAVIRMYGGDNPDGMRGVRLDGVVIDEVAQIKPEVWNDIIQPALSDRKGWALFIGTPNGVNLFSELYFKAKNYPDWYSNLFTVYDTQSIDPDEVKRLERDMTENSFAREYLCDFSAAGVDQLISIYDTEEACKRQYTARDISFRPRILGVDPARFGDDRAVIVKRQGLQMFPPLMFRGLDNMQLAAHVVSVIDAWQPHAIFIDAGNGSGVIDRVRQLRPGANVVEINFGGVATDTHYANMRTQMWFGIRDWLRDGGAIPNEVDIKQDLAGPTYSYDNKNRFLLEKKDDMKERGLPSPDIGDALALTLAYPVEIAEPVGSYPQPDIPGQKSLSSTVKKNYDPYENLT